MSRKKLQQKPLQMPLIKSVSYDSFFDHMLEVWKLKPLIIIKLIEKDLPWLLDPNYERPTVKRASYE
jgi:hypothetical protein